MKNTHIVVKTSRHYSGFTLIELLVVVLIVGILAVVALPRMEVAVEKARAIEAITNGNALAKALELYVLANGYPEQQIIFIQTENPNSPYVSALLDIDIEPKFFDYFASCDNTGCNWSARRKYDSGFDYDLYRQKDIDRTIQYCWGHNDKGQAVCKRIAASYPQFPVFQ